ncbi:hypothetical protein [Pseudoxanthomonas sp. z9]|uniref:hypothetical protein n=1 Tax=Pseudoxanthomonas sp. z9 TaxID=2584942 RepID=UPI001142ED5C|nr:hypothetical protein [Pseudoxanthomonas sp. z9]
MKNPTPRFHFPLALLVAAMAASTPAVAQDREAQEQRQETPPRQTDTPPANDAATPAPRPFEELDANGDGSVSKDEAAVDPALTQAFGTLDQDADGKLAPAEYAAYKPAGNGR